MNKPTDQERADAIARKYKLTYVGCSGNANSALLEAISETRKQERERCKAIARRAKWSPEPGDGPAVDAQRATCQWIEDEIEKGE